MCDRENCPYGTVMRKIPMTLIRHPLSPTALFLVFPLDQITIGSVRLLENFCKDISVFLKMAKPYAPVGLETPYPP